ncbi:MAG: choice-of-anchor D domain-containing protein, partial [Deltaproteobacteria bacterium]|nr:choice-of-anchor D domain-containing protein [Deltaproteobacteria bacterium]
MSMRKPSLSFVALFTLAFGLFGAVTACKQQNGLHTLTPGIDVSPTTLAFAPAPVGSAQQILVDVTNVGTADLVIANIKVAADPNSEIAVAQLLENDCHDVRRSGGLTLQPSECARFAVRWTPTAPHAAAGKIEIDSNDPDHQVVNLDVTGQGKSARMRVCGLDPSGQPIADECSKLEQSPPVIPTISYAGVVPNIANARTVRIFNDGDAQLLFTDTKLDATTNPAFSLGGTKPQVIEPGASADLTLTVTAPASGTYRGALTIITNDPYVPTLNVPLIAASLGWKLCIDPDTGLDFGAVPINQSRTLTLTFTNCGSADFTIKSLTFSPFAPTTHEFTIPAGSLPAASTTFSAGDSLKFDVTYSPTQVRNDDASFDFILDIPGAGPGGTLLEIRDSREVIGSGQPPVCNGTAPTAAFTTVRKGVTVDPATFQFDPLDTITLDGTGSTAPNGALTYLWRVASQPAGATDQIAGTGSKVQLQMRQAGDYVVELLVKDSACQSAPLQKTLHVVPKGALHVELTWPQNYGDVDLHLTGPGGQMFQNNCGGNQPCGDVFFAVKQPDWGCANQSCSAQGGVWPDRDRTNDASLDIDQRWGLGPENITYTKPFDGAFDINIHYWCSRQDGPFG